MTEWQLALLFGLGGVAVIALALIEHKLGQILDVLREIEAKEP